MGKRPASWIQLTLIYLGLVGVLSAGWLRQPLGTFSRAQGAPRIHAAAQITPVRHVVTFQQGVEGYGGCADTRISGENPNANFGNEDLYLGIRGRVGSLIRFDVSSIPPYVTVEEATLGLYVWRSGPSPAEPLICAAYSVNRPWEEMEATWVKATDFDNWGLPGCSDVPSDRSATPLDQQALFEREQWYTWNVTSAAQAWVSDPASNKGVFIRQTNVEVGGEYYARSSEWGVVELRPYLTVRYALPTPTPTPTNTATPTATPTHTPTPTITLTPTPSEYWLYLPVVLKNFPLKCVEWDDVLTEEFNDPLLGGWSLNMEGGQKRVWGSMLDLWADPFVDRFPLVWRNDLFEGSGSDFVVEVRFQYCCFTGYGTTIALNSIHYDGERLPESPVLPPGYEDILSIHHVVDPIRGIYRYDASLLGGLVVWDNTPGDTSWHVARVTLEQGERYTLYVDGKRIGSADSTARPRSLYIGNPFIVPGYGPWTQLKLDYIQVSRCLEWGP